MPPREYDLNRRQASLKRAQEALVIWRKHRFRRREAAKEMGVPCSTFDHYLRNAAAQGLVASIDSDAVYRNAFSPRLHLDIADGVVLVGSDCHYWPTKPSCAHQAFVQLCKELKPKIVVLNGDVLDGARISRHPPIMGADTPPLTEELLTCKLRLQEIKDACPHGTKLVFTIGNHDARYERQLAMLVPEFVKMHGVRLQDHFPDWEIAWATWLNNDVVIKHRFKGGVHAVYNNTLHAGKTIFTGHLHQLRVTALADYTGNRWGVDTGTIASVINETEHEAKQIVGEQFDYLEDNPVNWRSGFIVATFHKKILLWPEVVYCMDDRRWQFRGKIYQT